MTSHAIIDTKLAIELRRSGAPWPEVALECKSTVHLVRKALTEAGIPHWRRYKTVPLLTPYNLARIKRLKVAGATWKELARITGINQVRLMRYVNSH